MVQAAGVEGEAHPVGALPGDRGPIAGLPQAQPLEPAAAGVPDEDRLFMEQRVVAAAVVQEGADGQPEADDLGGLGQEHVDVALELAAAVGLARDAQPQRGVDHRSAAPQGLRLGEQELRGALRRDWAERQERVQAPAAPAVVAGALFEVAAAAAEDRAGPVLEEARAVVAGVAGGAADDRLELGVERGQAVGAADLFHAAMLTPAASASG